MKYCGGTFSRPKTTLCAAEIMVVGHRCTYDGRLPETDRVGIIKWWSACNDVSEVRMFLGTIGVCRVFIKDFAQHNWAMQDLKDALEDAVPLGNIDYKCDNPVVLAVDTFLKLWVLHLSRRAV